MPGDPPTAMGQRGDVRATGGRCAPRGARGPQVRAMEVADPAVSGGPPTAMGQVEDAKVMGDQCALRGARGPRVRAMGVVARAVSGDPPTAMGQLEDAKAMGGQCAPSGARGPLEGDATVQFSSRNAVSQCSASHSAAPRQPLCSKCPRPSASPASNSSRSARCQPGR